MENIPRAIKEFNEFKYKYEDIYTKSKWEGNWYNNAAVLLISAEYLCGNETEIEKCHINFCHKYWGSKRFNEWLNKYNFSVEWYDSCVMYIYLNKS